MKNLILAVLSVFFLAGCTKETYIEGLETVVKSFTLNQTLPIINGQALPVVFNVEGSSYLIRFNMSRYRATMNNATFGVLTNDSVIYVTMTSQLPIVTKTNAVSKYNYGELISSTETSTSIGIPLLEAIKKSPYTTGYNSVSKIGNLTLNFGIEEDGYIAFNLKKDDVQIFGWIHIIINDKKIICDKYGYQTFTAINAGSE